MVLLANRWSAKDVAADVGAAGCAALCVSPFVVVVDRAIAESGSGKMTVWQSFFGGCRQLLSSPHTYVRQPAFRYLACLFGGTYLAANFFTTYEEKAKVSQPVRKAGTIFAVNSSLALWKDSALAKLFGKVVAPVPWSALCTWWARDAIGMSVIFVAPPIAAKYVHENYDVPLKKAEVGAQIALPLMIQPIVGPFHLLGYVLYNQPNAGWPSIMETMRKEVLGTICMRWFRVFPPFSIGTVVNKNLRSSLKQLDYPVPITGPLANNAVATE
eukprot:TRINITY_DN27380_c0_g1_i1.p1 TRINITY_DN27380_c0_g1~~TRINITY_DN27380_c0_g1_i1.p1  ORF type:complete len:271 (-),score=36.36 TRINITY_DN27380_c0_g1_i1:264-1076(-)